MGGKKKFSLLLLSLRLGGGPSLLSVSLCSMLSGLEPQWRRETKGKVTQENTQTRQREKETGRRLNERSSEGWKGIARANSFEHEELGKLV